MLTLKTASQLTEPCSDAEGVADDLRDTGAPDRLIPLTDREILRLVWWMRARRDDGAFWMPYRLLPQVCGSAGIRALCHRLA